MIYSCSNNDGKHLLEVKNIIRCEGVGNYTLIHCLESNPLSFSKTLLIVEEELQKYNSFVRIHRAHLINVEYIACVSRKDGGTIRLKSGEEFAIARARRAEVKKMIDAYCTDQSKDNTE